MESLKAQVRPGVPFQVRVTPRAGRDAVAVEEGAIRVRVTAAPADGKANEAARAAIAQALGVAKTRVALIRGARSRDKVFQLD